MKLSSVETLLFTKHLSVMLKAGISLPETLETLIQQTTSSGFKKIIGNILLVIRNGQHLSDALSLQPKSFDRFYISLVRIGEESGTLSQNLEFLSVKLDKDNSLRKKIQGVLFYPSIVIGAALVMGFGLGVFILPKLSDLFSSLDVALPLSTRILMWLADITKRYNVLIAIGFIAITTLLYLVLHSRLVRPHWQSFLLSLPVLGPFLVNIEMASFSRNLGTMLRGGLTITSAIGITADSTSNLIFRSYFNNLNLAITKGKSLGDELSTGYPKFPITATKMIAVGEKSGNLDEMLLYLGDFFETEIDSTAKTFSTILEPILLLIVGLIVAFLALAIISPIYQLTGSIK